MLLIVAFAHGGRFSLHMRLKLGIDVPMDRMGSFYSTLELRLVSSFSDMARLNNISVLKCKDYI